MKATILELLKTDGSTVSGESISKQIGISRVAVWKHLQQMQEAGLNLESTGKGYRLVSLPDITASWLFGERAKRIHCFEQVTTTMDKALALARGDCPDFTVVVADRQSEGRGRLMRRWDSQDGGLYFTMVLRPTLNPGQAGRVHLAAAVDMARTLRELYGIEARLKWPNDILVEDRKIVGILSQMVTEMDLVKFVNVGIGVNVNNSFSDEAPEAVSIEQLIGKPVPRAAVLEAFLERFEQRFAEDPDLNISPEWKAMAMTIGRKVTVKTTRDTVTGTAVDIDEEGGLVVALDDGGIRRIVFGDCFHRN